MKRDLSTRTDREVANARSSDGEIDAFLARAKVAAKGPGVGRLIFALDATMSRQPTWDSAMANQSRMFETVGKVGALDVQLVYFRGFGECRASRWVSDPSSLRSLMERIDCRGGQTQLRKVLAHAAKEARRGRVAALVYIGDAMEENIDSVCTAAGELGLRGIPCFMFHEGRDQTAERAFREIARLSKGAYVRFGSGSASKLADLLSAVAAYAAGGLPALEKRGGESDRKLLEQLR